MAQARKKPVATKARALPTDDRKVKAAIKAVKQTVTGRPATLSPDHKKILSLQTEVSRLQNRLMRQDRELTAALNRADRAHGAIKVLSALLTSSDTEVLTRRQLDDEIPF